MPNTGSPEQAVSGRQAAAAAAAEMGLSILAKSFRSLVLSLLNLHLLLLCLSPSLSLSLTSAVVDPPHAEPPTHTHIQHTHGLLPL